ncbi:MAG TPA: universal stress protein [Chryseosolibacter sp.]
MKKILVPTDLSETAELGVKLAVEIAKRCGATVSLVNFTRHPMGSTFSATGEVDLHADDEENAFTLQLLQTKKEQLELLVEKYSGNGVTFESAVVDSKFKSGMDALMSQQDIDLIVMGTSGEENAKEIFLGNHTEQAIKVSPVPVLSVRDGFSINEFDNIVMAVTVITDNQVADGLEQLKKIWSCFNSHVHLVHVRDRQDDSNMILDEYFTRMANIAGVPRFSVAILDGDDPAEQISEYAERVNAGLIAVLKNSKDGIFRMFGNRFTNRIIKEEGRPVFTLNLQNT